jgi:hypothetical protein
VTTIPLRDVAKPQHLRCFTRGEMKNADGSLFFGDVVMDVYTGTLAFTFDSADISRTTVRSFVPLGDPGPNGWEIQNYISGRVKPIASASLASFASDPDLAAVDAASVRLQTKNFRGQRPAQVLVIEAQVAVAGGRLHRIAYQVTALSRPLDTSHPIAELGNNVLSLPGEEAP